MIPEFKAFRKIAHLSREIIITEKIDGTNGIIHISDDGTEITAGSRTHWLTLEADNHGFARWVEANKSHLYELGPGYHYGEWWGSGIQRGYGLKEKRFSLFNSSVWRETRPAVCFVVPELYVGPFDMTAITEVLNLLRTKGSVVAPGFMKPEGIVIFHVAGNCLFKKTLEHDEIPKGKIINWLNTPLL